MSVVHKQEHASNFVFAKESLLKNVGKIVQKAFRYNNLWATTIETEHVEDNMDLFGRKLIENEPSLPKNLKSFSLNSKVLISIIVI